ncbi:MAG TPA: glycosyltransferase [Bryobacteraceae bacterium]|jgi:glycosyltransferase involved in cell wall biosynthesis|nr:glycosyltransferase [Bryobacteraceae bacterium]
MKILQVHNFYQQPGGEDLAFATECDLLTSHGHTVLRYTAHNDAITGMSSLGSGFGTVWNSTSFRNLTQLLKTEAPDIVHAHNTFPLISPSLYDAAHHAGIPVVQTLHNYRLLCPSATLYRNGTVCEECVGSLAPYRAVIHGCYRNSSLASAAVASMLTIHRIAGTWTRKVNTYIALTEFARNKFIQGGLPSERITVKPCVLAEDPGEGDGGEGYALFAGRLAPEKGLGTLLDAWERLGGRMPLRIAGSGPLAHYVQSRCERLANTQYLGQCSRATIRDLLQKAAVLVVPSGWYEGCPLSIVEAFACGTPVIASRLGSLGEVVSDGANGFHFHPHDPADLADKVERVLADTGKRLAMRRAARATYEAEYTAEMNYQLLLEIYRKSLDRAVEYTGALQQLQSSGDPQ